MLQILPLVIFYQIGVLIADRTSGVDLVSLALRYVCGSEHLILAESLLSLFFIALILIVRDHQTLRLRSIAPVIFEGALYAITMGSVIVIVMVDFLHLDPKLTIPPRYQTLDYSALAAIYADLVVAAGAGVYEELVFRLVLIDGGSRVFRWTFAAKRGPALVNSIVISSLLFSFAHHLGDSGDAFTLGSALYRFLAGLVLAGIYRIRGLSVAVYTHTLYDIFVLFFTSTKP